MSASPESSAGGSRRHFLARMGAWLAMPALTGLPTGIRAAVTGNANPAAWAVNSDPGLWSQAWAARFTQPLLNPLQTTALAGLGAASGIFKPDPGSASRYTILTSATSANVLGVAGKLTQVWGYRNHETAAPTFPGRSFEVQRNQAVTVAWRNQLANASGPLPHLLPVDQTITLQSPTTGVPTAVHHHGGNSAAEFDGGPDQWTTPLRRQVGPGITGANLDPAGGGVLYQYTNDQEASMHWYHDHAESLTRINVHAGLAGLYVVRDANEAFLQTCLMIPKAPYEIALVLQDRCFDANGQFTYAADPTQYPAPISIPSNQPTHFPEMFGDVMLVNGRAWPTAAIEPRPYRLRLLNGSDSRFYTLNFGVPTYQIGTDLGFLPRGVAMSTVTLAPGERLDLVVDFSGRANQSFVVTNSAPTPFPGGALPTGGMTQVMRFQTSVALNWWVPLTLPWLLPYLSLRVFSGGQALQGGTALTAAARSAAAVRRVFLGEGVDPYGRITPMLGTYHPTNAALNRGTLSFQDAPTETPRAGTTEVWEFWNATVDAHPVHMHLVGFQVIDRQVFTAPPLQATTMSNGWSGVKLVGPVTMGATTPVAASEGGFKDTVICPPGQVTRVLVNFPRAGKYVYHCHILSHEEHDMMRWYQVL